MKLNINFDPKQVIESGVIQSTTKAVVAGAVGMMCVGVAYTASNYIGKLAKSLGEQAIKDGVAAFRQIKNQ